MRDDLEPCPFCGVRNAVPRSSGRWGWFVSCACNAVGPNAGSREGAIKAWNTRRPPSQPSLFPRGEL